MLFRSGAMSRTQFGDELKQLPQDERAKLRNLGVRFGEYTLHMPALLKPAPSALLATFWVLRHGGFDEVGGLTTLAATGRTSVPVDPAIPAALYRVVGYRVAGNMAIRIDILERLADLIRPLIAWRPTTDRPEPPEGAVPGNGFTVTVAMTSLLGCSGEDFSSVLRALGYRMERKPKPAEPPAAGDAATSGGDTGDAPAGDAEPPEETAVAADGPIETAVPDEAAGSTAPDGGADQPVAVTEEAAPVAPAEAASSPWP